MARKKAVRVMPEENEDPFEITKAQEAEDDYSTAIISESDKSDDESDDYPEADYVSRQALSLYLKRVGNHAFLSREEETILAKKARTGDIAARNELVEKNLDFVVNIAKRFRGCGLPLEDLVAIGNLELTLTVGKFNPFLGRLTTYAESRIRQACARAIAGQKRLINIPVEDHAGLLRLAKARATLEQSGRLSPTAAELAFELECTVGRVEKLLYSEQVRCQSLSSPVGEDAELGDFISDPDGQDPQEIAHLAILRQRLFATIVKAPLDDRQRGLLLLRHKFFLDREVTLGHCGVILYVTGLSDAPITWERVRQIQEKALRICEKLIEDDSVRGGEAPAVIEHLRAKLEPCATRFIQLRNYLSMSPTQREAVGSYYSNGKQPEQMFDTELEEGLRILSNLEYACWGSRTPRISINKANELLMLQDKMNRKYHTTPRSRTS